MRHRAKIKRSTDGCTNVVIKGGVSIKHGAKAKIKLCSSDGLHMGRRSNDAAVKDALTKSSEECALDMVQSENYASVKGAQKKLRKEEFVSSMGHVSNDAAVKDAQIMS